jgi:hypothetical protein
MHQNVPLVLIYNISPLTDCLIFPEEMSSEFMTPFCDFVLWNVSLAALVLLSFYDEFLFYPISY